MNINNILVVGGTHGNELSGVSLIKDCQRDSQVAALISKQAPSAQINFILSNPAAIENRVRFVEEDLNRQFTQAKLAAECGESLEHQLALDINQQFGPKHKPKYDLVVDIHNTTSNMAATLIVLESDDFHRGLARYVSMHMPDVYVLVEDQLPFKEQHYLCTLGEKGVMIEVGPQAQGILRAKAYQQSLQMARLIASYAELVNTKGVPELPSIDAYKYITDISYPCDEHGNKLAMLHPKLQDQDFTLLQKGMPIFIDAFGNTTDWQGDDVYPHFVGEAAYYHLGLAFATAHKISF